MPTSGDLGDQGAPVLLDTSAAIPYLDPEDESHELVRTALAARGLGLAGHAEFETYSVLTRRPPPMRVTARAASLLLAQDFPETRHLGAESAAALRPELAALGIAGGAVYDALVGAAAREHKLVLVTRDPRAERTYRALGLGYQLL